MAGESPARPALQPLFTEAWSIDRRSGTPAYEQITQRLVDLIEVGRLSVGDRLPPERELATWVGVSRMTARAALGSLAQRGLIDRDVGRGTFVARPKFEHDLGRLAGFTDMAQRQGLAATARVRAINELPAPAAVTDTLAIAPGAPAYRIERLRFAGEEPIALEDSWIPVAPFPGLLDHDVRGSIYALMRDRYATPPVRAVERLEPRLAEPHHAEVLGVAAGAPLMLITRIAFGASGEPIELAHDLYRGDRARFVIEVGPPRPAPV